MEEGLGKLAVGAVHAFLPLPRLDARQVQ